VLRLRCIRFYQVIFGVLCSLQNDRNSIAAQAAGRRLPEPTVQRHIPNILATVGPRSDLRKVPFDLLFRTRVVRRRHGIRAELQSSVVGAQTRFNIAAVFIH
jgi:hypothetical protein